MKQNILDLLKQNSAVTSLLEMKKGHFRVDDTIGVALMFSALFKQKPDNYLIVSNSLYNAQKISDTIATLIGFLFCIIAFIMIIVIIVKTLVYGDPTAGWPSMACIIFLVSGIQLMCIGVIGEYLAKMYLEVKNRPIYIIKETNIKK